MDGKKGKAPATRDYFAELYVAGLMGDRKWNVYFPKRDDGFDFVATKVVGGGTVIRPVQVKGLYPTREKLDKVAYRWTGRLSQTHPSMILALVYFSPDHETPAPECVAFMPFSMLKPTSKGGWRVEPVSLKAGKVIPRKSYVGYFGKIGMQYFENDNSK